MRRDERNERKRPRCPESARARFYEHLDTLCMLRQVVVNDWRQIQKLMAKYPELRREMPPRFNELRLVVDDSPKRPAGKVARYRSSQNDDGPEAA
jgi:hypothetical protein